MKVEVAKHTRMSERGSSLLRLIQNNDMPLLDLLVRESIQNSLDASVSHNNKPVNISFRINEFEAAKLNHELEGAESALNRRFPEKMYSLLEIRDSGTTGLTGPLNYKDIEDDNFGNLLKLIYEISIPQHKEGAGGSWGLGKTVYFRIGIGLVFYYTRILNDDGSYASRLAACLVENEKNHDSILGSIEEKPKRGIAWWGDEASPSTTIPITNEEEIRKILSIFDTEPYSEDETGTSIIIPYINQETLLNGIFPSDTGKDGLNNRPWWTKSVEEYIRVAVQRWYAPRLSNDKYEYGKWMRVFVNQEEIKRESMLPLFKTVQSLYNRTISTIGSNAKCDFLANAEVAVEKISLRNIFSGDSTAGHVAFVKLSKDNLLMLPPNNHCSPYYQANILDIEENGGNPPLIMYVRKPGMIVEYVTSGPWTDGIPKTDANEFIIGIFVANSMNTFKNVNEVLTVEEYLRKSEKADHTSWSDWSGDSFNPFTVSKIQRHVRKHITVRYTENQEKANNYRQNNGLGKILAQLLLPPENFGSKASIKNKKSTENGGNGNRSVRGIKFSPITFEDGQLKVDYELKCKKADTLYLIQAQILMENGVIEPDGWESDLDRPFPLEIKHFSVNKIWEGTNKPKEINQLSISKERQSSEGLDNIKISFVRTSQHEVLSGVRINLDDTSITQLSGSLIFTSSDNKLQGRFVLKENEGAGA
ncbi:hypothetical protein J45TS6_08300 [Paenibacillus sp. J45TS6]|uniref:hypothetical protein n=1 Tax=Paenibacillus sp. J45TS6 TaxID=2807196 RepID=UPI001B111ACA|nr:hypothetical protein [Paenibacillus sp. J45TS6]GIP42371.1 hypothetical protein J45TS6_08300 [Paenibacillus sp. J45TS6]